MPLSNQLSGEAASGLAVTIAAGLFLVVIVFVPIFGFALLGTFLWLLVMAYRRGRRLRKAKQFAQTWSSPIGVGYAETEGARS